MRNPRVFPLLVALLLAGCTSKNPTSPTITNSYSLMYGTWIGQEDFWGNGGAYPVGDSVRLVISATAGTPDMHLYERMLGLTSPPAPWREVALDSVIVEGGENFEAVCGPDTALALPFASEWPGCHLFAQAYPITRDPGVSPIAGFGIYRTYPMSSSPGLGGSGTNETYSELVRQ